MANNGYGNENTTEEEELHGWVNLGKLLHVEQRQSHGIEGNVLR
jgi:hypothetical protein